MGSQSARCLYVLFPILAGIVIYSNSIVSLSKSEMSLGFLPSINEDLNYTANDMTLGHGFGTSLDTDGNVLVIGAECEELGETGCAYVYRENGGEWQLEQKLEPDDGVPGQGFGGAVAVDGDTIVVGSRSHDNGGTAAGAIFIFEWDGNNWIQARRFIPEVLEDFDRFGTDVDIDGDTIIVGSPARVSKTRQGSVYVISNDGSDWAVRQNLTGSRSEIGDNFGDSVSISGSRFAVGAYLNEENGVSGGGVYIFSENGGSWSQSQFIRPREIDAGNIFGTDVYIDGDDLVIGDSGDDTNANASGAAYLFRPSDTNPEVFVEEQKFLSPENLDFESFGSKVSVTNGIVAVGAPSGISSATSTEGRVYLFQNGRNGWTRTSHSFAGAAIADRFGSKIVIQGTSFFAVANRKSNGPSVFQFARVSSNWLEVSDFGPRVRIY